MKTLPILATLAGVLALSYANSVKILGKENLGSGQQRVYIEICGGMSISKTPTPASISISCSPISLALPGSVDYICGHSAPPIGSPCSYERCDLNGIPSNGYGLDISTGPGAATCYSDFDSVTFKPNDVIICC